VKMKRSLVLSITLFLFVFSIIAVYSQETGVIVQTRINGRVEPYWHDSLDSALLAVESIAQVQRWAGDELSSAQLETAVEVRPNPNNPNRIVANWKITLVKNEQVLAEGSIQGLVPRERDLADYFWIPLLEAMEEAVAQVEPEPLEGFIVRGLSGTRIDLGVGDTLAISEDGQLWVPGTLPSTYTIAASLSGYYREKLSVGIQRSGEIVEIDQQRLSRLSIDLALYMMQFPEVSLTLRLGQGGFARITLQQFLAGLYLSNERNGYEYDPNAEAQSIFLSLPLIQPGILFGAFLNSPEKRFRPYGGLGAFARLVVSPEIIGVFDPIAPWGLSGVIGLEYARSRRFGIFGELGENGYFPSNPGLFAYAASLKSDGNNLPGLGTILGPAVIEFPVGRFGVRFRL